MPKLNMANILARLRALKPMIEQRYKVKSIELFGSYIRGEQIVSSDIDILVDFKEDADLFDLIGLAQFLEEELRQRVDVVPKRALKPELRDTVLKEVVIV